MNISFNRGIFASLLAFMVGFYDGMDNAFTSVLSAKQFLRDQDDTDTLIVSCHGNLIDIAATFFALGLNTANGNKSEEVEDNGHTPLMKPGEEVPEGSEPVVEPTPGVEEPLGTAGDPEGVQGMDDAPSTETEPQEGAEGVPARGDPGTHGEDLTE